MMMREAFPGCAYAWELRELQAEGLVQCGESEELPCESTCAPTIAAEIFFPSFVVLANFILLQLVVAAMLEFLKDPVRRATENAHVIRTRRQGLLPLAVIKLSWRRWRFKAHLRPPLQELVRHTRLVTHQRYLAAQQQRQDVADRLRQRQRNKQRRAEARADMAAAAAAASGGIDLSRNGKGAGGRGVVRGLVQDQAAVARRGSGGLRLNGVGGAGLAHGARLADSNAMQQELPVRLRSPREGDSQEPLHDYEALRAAGSGRRDRVTSVEAVHAASADLCFPLARSAAAVGERNDKAGALTSWQAPGTCRRALVEASAAAHSGRQAAPSEGAPSRATYTCEFGCGFSSVSRKVSERRNALLLPCSEPPSLDPWRMLNLRKCWLASAMNPGAQVASDIHACAGPRTTHKRVQAHGVTRHPRGQGRARSRLPRRAYAGARSRWQGG